MSDETRRAREQYEAAAAAMHENLKGIVEGMQLPGGALGWNVYTGIGGTFLGFIPDEAAVAAEGRRLADAVERSL